MIRAAVEYIDEIRGNERGEEAPEECDPDVHPPVEVVERPRDARELVDALQRFGFECPPVSFDCDRER